MSCANHIWRLLKSHGWDTDLSKPLPSEMVPSSASKFDCVDSSPPIDNNRKSVNENFTQNVNESFQEENGLNSSVSSLVHETGTCTDHPNNTYGAKNNQLEINLFSVHGSKSREPIMRNFTSYSASATQVQDSEDSSSTMKFSHDEEKIRVMEKKKT